MRHDADTVLRQEIGGGVSRAGTYYVGGDELSGRSLMFGVRRPGEIPGQFGGRRQELEVSVVNSTDASVGVDRPAAGDLVDLPRAYEQDVVRWRVAEVLPESNAAVWRLRLVGEGEAT